MLSYFILGTSCETRIDNCLGNQCKNGATCVSKQAGYSCSCNAGFSGQLCEIDIDECSANPCKHGQCTDGINKYMCSCYAGYTGANCSININDCETRWVLCLCSVRGEQSYNSGKTCETHINHKNAVFPWQYYIWRDLWCESLSHSISCLFPVVVEDTIRHCVLCVEWILFSVFQSFNVFYIDVSLFSHIPQQLTIQSQSKLGDTWLSSCAPNVGVQDLYR